MHCYGPDFWKVPPNNAIPAWLARVPIPEKGIFLFQFLLPAGDSLLISCRKRLESRVGGRERRKCGGQFFKVRRVISHQLLQNILSITSLKKINCSPPEILAGLLEFELEMLSNLFPLLTLDETSTKDGKQKSTRVMWEMRLTFSAARIINHRNKLPKEVEEFPNLGVFKAKKNLLSSRSYRVWTRNCWIRSSQLKNH